MADRNEIARAGFKAGVKAATPDDDVTKPSNWFRLPAADQLTRRRQVFGLLGWYHETIVLPNRGIPGVLRRLWWRLTGNKAKLVSPWQLLLAKLQDAERLEAEQQELALRAAAGRAAVMGDPDTPPETGRIIAP